MICLTKMIRPGLRGFNHLQHNSLGYPWIGMMD